MEQYSQNFEYCDKKMIPRFSGEKTNHRNLKFIFLKVIFWGLCLNKIYFSESCPVVHCTCIWKNGKQTVECVNQSLRTFPGPIDGGTQVLDLSGNSFETLPSDHFMRLSLINLQKIYLPKCRLSHINSRAFRGLTNLVDLDLANNALREVPTSSFSDCQGLLRLILSGNPISHLQRNAFSGLESLTSLEMSHCGIEVIEKRAFEGLHKIEYLKLDGNKLKRIDGLELFPLKLKGVSLEENPWECDCRLLELRIWLGETKRSNSFEPRCVTPSRLTNATLKDLPLESFACVPNLSPTTMYQKIGEGKNVSILCKVTSTPESNIEWWFNGQPISNTSLNILVETSTSVPNQLLSSSLGPPLREKKSELFILNATSEENGTFLCVAKNPAGIAMANFTLRVLSLYDGDSYTENVTSFVGTYPNLFLIAISSIAVILALLLILFLTVVVCKCFNICKLHRRGSDQRLVTSGPRNKSDTNKNGKEMNNSVSGGSVSVCGSKMDRHLSETSTLTTHTKSNGSVFLLSTSSELGDSNPDLIEGVKGVGTGHETCFSHLGNGSAFNSEIPLHHSAIGNPPNVNSNSHPSMESFTVSPYCMEYGLPKSLNVGTLVRRSPSYPVTANTSTNTLPLTYDLAKYPKEYISTAPSLGPSYIYGPSGPVVYASNGPSSSQYHPNTSYQTYLIPHSATFIYGPDGEEYVPMGYIDTSTTSGTCSCGPILEENEDIGLSESTTIVQEPGNCSTRRADSSPAKATTNNGKIEIFNVKARLQRQLTTQVNESPDEGYEDESAEGAEI